MNKFQRDKTGGLNMRRVEGKRDVQHRLNTAFSKPKKTNSLSIETAVRRDSVFGKVLLRIRVIK
jgi:hypothetical protein